MSVENKREISWLVVHKGRLCLSIEARSIPFDGSGGTHKRWRYSICVPEFGVVR
jgi:hypothetical protein